MMQASAGMEFILLEDGRRLCPECSSFKIMDINDCQPLILEIQQFFATLNMKLDQKIPLALVASETLNKPSEDKDNVRGHTGLFFCFFIHIYLYIGLTFLGFICLDCIDRSSSIRNSRVVLNSTAPHSHC